MPGRTPPFESRLAPFHRAADDYSKRCGKSTRRESMDQRIINLYHHFTHGGINRRQFLDQLTEKVGSAPPAAPPLPLLQNDYANAALAEPDDPPPVAQHGSYDSPDVRTSGD